MQKPEMLLPLNKKDLSMSSTKKFELEIIGKYKKQNKNSYLISGGAFKRKKEKRKPCWFVYYRADLNFYYREMTKDDK